MELAKTESVSRVSTYAGVQVIGGHVTGPASSDSLYRGSPLIPLDVNAGGVYEASCCLVGSTGDVWWKKSR